MNRIEQSIKDLRHLQEISYQADIVTDAPGSAHCTYIELSKASFDETIRVAVTMLMCKESTVIPFIQRQLLSKCCDEWMLKNGASPETFTVITFLAAKGCLRLDDVYRIIGNDLL